MTMTKILVNAGPGTGKTRSSTRLCRWLKSENKNRFLEKTPHTEEQLTLWKTVEQEFDLNPKSQILYAAYNADFVPEVQPLVPKAGPYAPKVSTIHGAGYGVLRTKYGYIKLNNNRGASIVSAITGQNFFKLRNRFQWFTSLKYMEKLKEELLSPNSENFELLRQKYDSLANLPIHPELESQCLQMIPYMKKIDRSQGIEYIDQVWLPIFILKKPIYDLGIIDECQDLSAVRLKLVEKLCRQLLFVGDPDQAINYFAGADSRAFDKIRLGSNIELPLKTSFRNPPNIVNKANDLMKNRIIADTSKRVWLRAHKTEPGPEGAYTLNEIATHITDDYENHMILCRYNAPLVRCAVKLTMAGIPCFIYGKSLVKELINIVNNRKPVDIDDLLSKLDTYEENTRRSVDDQIFEIIKDKLDCVRYICKTIDDIEEFESATKELIREKKSNSVNLCTIHKSKGRERRNVHILYPPVESEWAKSLEQKQQEQNLHYVALTRTSYSYYLIHKE